MAKKSPKPIDLSNQPSGDAAQAIGTSDHQTAEQHTRELFRREESRYREKGAANPDRQVYDYVRKDWRSDTSDFIDTIKPLTGLSGQPLVSASGTLPIGTDTKRSGEQTPLGSATQPDTNTGRTTAFSGMSIDWKQALPGAEAWNVTYGAKSGNGTDAPRTDNTNTTGTDASRPLPATKGLPNDINVTATKTELPPITPTSVTSNGMPQITPPVSERAPVSVTRSESPPTNGGSLPPSNFGTTSATKAVAKDAVSTTNNTTDGILPSIPRTINGAREVTPISTVQPSGQPISTPGLPATPGTTGGVRENPVNLRTGEQPVARLANSGQATPALPANDGRAPSPTGSPTGGTVMRPPTDTSLPKTQPADPPKKSEPASWAGTALATGNKSMVGAITNAASSQGSRTSNIITDQPSNPGTAEPGSRPASSITRPEIVGTNRTSGEPSRRADTPVNPSDTNALRVRTGDTEPKGSPSNTTPQIGRAADSGSAPNTPDVNAQRGAIPGQIAGKGIADILDTTLSPAKSATAPTTSDTTTPRSTRSLDPNPAIKTALPDLTGPQSRGGADLTLPTDKSSVRSLSAGTGTGTASDTTLPGSGSSRPDITGKGAVAPAADTAKNPETNRTETTTRTVGNNTPKSPADTTKTASPPQPETAKPAGVRGPGSTSSDAAKSEDPRAVSAKSDGGKTQISGSKPDISKADVTKTVSSGTVAGPQVDTRSEAPRAVTPKSASPNGEETKVGATKPDSPRTIPAKSDSSTKTEPPRADGVHGQPARTTGPKGDTAATKVDAPKTVPVKGESTKTANSDGTKIPPTKGDGPRSEKADGTKIIPAKGDGAKAERTDGTKIVPTKGDGARSEKTDGTKIVPTTGDGARSQKSDGTKIVPAKADGPRSEKADGTKIIPAKGDGARSEKADSTKIVPAKADGGKSERTDGTKIVPAKGDGARSERTDGAKIVPAKGDGARSEKADGAKIVPAKGDGARSEKADGTKIVPAKADAAKSEKADGTKIVPAKADAAKSEKADGTKIVPAKADGGKSERTDGTKIVPPKADGGKSERTDGTKTVPAKADGGKSERTDGTKIVPAKADGGKSERTDGNKIVPAKGDGAKSEKTDGTKIVPAKGDGAKSEKTDGTKIPPAKVDGAKSEKTDGTKVPSAKGDGAKSEKTDGNKVVQAKADGTRPAVVAGVPPKADGSKVDGKVDHIKSGKPMADGCRPTEPTKNSKSEGVTGKVDSTKSQKSDAVTPAKGDGGVNPAGATGSTKGDVPAHKQPLQSNADGTKPQEGAKHPQPLKGDKPGSSDKPPLNSPFKATTNGANKANGSEVAQQTQPKRLVSGNSDAKRDSSDAQQHVRVNKLPWEKADSQQESESRNPKTEKKELEPVSRFASILRRGRDAKDHREEKISEIKTAAELRIQHQQRTKYIVQHGDTLASIALDQLGDSRFSNLILTINRGRISMVTRNGKQEPLLHEDQVLWLPTPNERDVYAKAIFSTKNAPKHNAIEVSLMHPAHSHDEPVPSVVLENIRRVNQPHSRTLHTIDLQISQSQLLNKLNALAENVSTSVWFAGEPAGAAEQPDKKGPATQAPRFFDIPGDMPPQVELLDASCRMVTEKNDSSTFSATLEMKVTEKWLRVACYEYRHGHGYRYSYYSNGEVKPFPMDLPLHVVLEMAREDFQRNWSAYCREFSKQNGFARA